MNDSVLIDELHVAVRVPAGLPEPEAEAVRRTLSGDAFADRLRDAIAAVVGAYPELALVGVTLSR